ncbi:hypothetical protein Tco_1361702 [Tanacetum coccineum]
MSQWVYCWVRALKRELQGLKGLIPPFGSAKRLRPEGLLPAKCDSLVWLSFLILGDEGYPLLISLYWILGSQQKSPLMNSPPPPPHCRERNSSPERSRSITGIQCEEDGRHGDMSLQGFQWPKSPDVKLWTTWVFMIASNKDGEKRWVLLGEGNKGKGKEKVMKFCGC